MNAGAPEFEARADDQVSVLVPGTVALASDSHVPDSCRFYEIYN